MKARGDVVLGRIIFVALLVFCGRFASAADTPALDAILAAPQLWETPADGFIEGNRPLGFRWVSAAKDEARTAEPGLTFLGVAVYECVVRFEAGKMKLATVSLFNRGDAGELSKEKFDALVKQAADGILKLTGKAFTPRGQETTSAVQAYALLWQTEQTKFLLEYSFTKEVKVRQVPYRAEFIRLQMTPAEKAQGLVATALAARQTERFSGPSHVTKDSDGGVRIEGIPMVDQGEKGYCVTATTERVLRYYGAHADEHEIAQIANSSAKTGTGVNELVASLKKVGSRLRVKVREVEKMDVRMIENEIREYNRAARHDGVDPIVISGHVIDVGDVYSHMKGATLRTARTTNRSDEDRFFREVQTSIDQGVPLLWSTTLGLLPQPHEPAEIGGHMRLIVGYNKTKSEIIYSDSWGMGHEFKHMPLADAWTITSALDVIEPF